MPPSLLDTNVLVHAAYRQSPLHAAAAELVHRGLRTRGIYCIAPQNLVEFCAVVSRQRLVSVSMPADEILRTTNLLYRSRTLTKIYPQRGAVMRAMREGTALEITGTSWYDLFLAVTMRDSGIHVVITENVSDFQQFPFVSVRHIRDAV